MPISDLISTSFLFSIAIIIILIGGIFAYVSYRMSEQDHKLTSMLGLVSTLAEEIHSLKGRLNDSIVLNTNGEEDGEEGDAVSESSRKEIHIFDQNMLSGGTDINLISVSDNESESESESDSESDSDSDSDSSNDSESDSLLVSNVKILNISHDNISHDNEFKEYLEEEDSFIPESFVQDFTEESLIAELAELTDLVEDLAEDLAENLDTKLIHLAEPIEFVSDSMLDISELKNIMISDKPDYKKMGLNKLREVVVERNILSAVEAGKLKKPELLKLIEDL
jgi:hypothetical protein